MPYSPPLTPDELKSILATMEPPVDYTYVKRRPMYVVGYTNHQVQILKGRVLYGGVSDLSADILGGVLSDVQAHIHGYALVDVNSCIAGHNPVDLMCFLRSFKRDESVVQSYIRGWGAKDVIADIVGFMMCDVYSDIAPIPPKDLVAYLKPWPMDFIYASIKGWGVSDFSGAVSVFQTNDVNGSIFSHKPQVISAYIYGFVSSTKDLHSYIRGFCFSDLQSHIRCTYYNDVHTFLRPVPPFDLSSFIHGWAESFVSVYISGGYGGGDLRASIVPSGDVSIVFASIKSTLGASTSLVTSNIHGYVESVVGAFLSPIPTKPLYADLTPTGGTKSIYGIIFPNRILLSAVISIITMHPSDLYASINIGCIYSGSSYFGAHIRSVYKSDLSAYIFAKPALSGIVSLYASVGRAYEYVHTDNLSVSLTLTDDFYKTIDILPISLIISRLIRGNTSIMASIASR